MKVAHTITREEKQNIFCVKFSMGSNGRNVVALRRVCILKKMKTILQVQKRKICKGNIYIYFSVVGFLGLLYMKRQGIADHFPTF